MRLSKEGYGSICEIKNLDVKTFMNLVYYENYRNKYLRALEILNERK